MIDEFDKMNDQDRTSIHEAMEQQTISISKAGIVTTLRARCSIIAAANPITGRYNPQKSLAENVELTDPILQRFDVLCVLIDTVDPSADERLAKFVVSSHVRSHPGTDDAEVEVQNVFAQYSDNEGPTGGYIDQDVLQKYIIYARSLKPQFQELDQEKLSALYVELRRESRDCGGVPIGVRHIESIMRMAEAFARIHLREYVREDDIDMAIRVMLDSFVQSQKFSVMRSLKRSFQKYIIYGKDHNTLLLSILEKLVNEQQNFLRLSQGVQDQSRVLVSLNEFEGQARELGIHNLNHFYNCDQFKKQGFTKDFVSDETTHKRQEMIIKAF